ncbi:hypothetical protein L916_17045 [Phytophthora nicotianae]|uniref:Uncharacterized protein n=1 Tax=Phytophthora nicotianae TaxID=4792 RepID=W2I904_PHYNI|nr:hypothetical protein L916_17045 [Phytophthora nicotianae]
MGSWSACVNNASNCAARERYASGFDNRLFAALSILSVSSQTKCFQLWNAMLSVRNVFTKFQTVYVYQFKKQPASVVVAACAGTAV